MLVLVLPDHRAGSGIALISVMLGVGSALGLPLGRYAGSRREARISFASGNADVAVGLRLPPQRSGCGSLGRPCFHEILVHTKQLVYTSSV
jgi:hypothetical protein